MKAFVSYLKNESPAMQRPDAAGWYQSAGC